MKHSLLFMAALALASTGCSSSSEAPPDEAPGDAGPGDLTAPTSDSAQAADSNPSQTWPPAYGIFQLYGDEYGAFRQKMGLSLEDYWSFVDQHVARLGARFTRTNTLLIWGLLEPTIGGGFDWENDRFTDRVLQATYAPSAGKEMDILAVIEPGRGDRKSPPFPTGRLPEYQAFVQAAVERYDGDGDEVGPNVHVRHWQVMNEPFWAFKEQRMTTQEYVELVKLTAAAVRAADPEAKIVLGDVGENLAQVVKGLANAGAFDAIDIHFWCTQDPCPYELHKLSAVRQLLDDNGYGAAEIWMGEFGTWANSAQGLPLHTAEDQARWLVKAMIANRAGGISRILWNNLVPWSNFIGSPNSVFNFMGLLSNGTDSGDQVGDVGNERISYHTFQRLIAATGTSAAELIAEQPTGVEGARAVLFKRRSTGQSFYVAWSDDGAKRVLLPWEGDEARVTNLIPDAAGSFTEKTVHSISGEVELEVGDDPLLIEPAAAQ